MVKSGEIHQRFRLSSTKRRHYTKKRYNAHLFVQYFTIGYYTRFNQSFHAFNKPGQNRWQTSAGLNNAGKKPCLLGDQADHSLWVSAAVGFRVK